MANDFLNYNTDFSQGYAPPAAPDTSRDWYMVNVLGKKAGGLMGSRNKSRYETWRDSVNSQYEYAYNSYNKAYDDWYNSPEQVIKRSSAAGQNPFYTDAITPGAVGAQSWEPSNSSHEYDEVGQIFDIVNGVRTGLQEVATMANNFQNDAVNREYIQQRAAGQFLDNAKQSYQLGLSSELPYYEVGSKGLNHALTKAGVYADKQLMGNSLFQQQIDAQIASALANTNMKKFQMENILPAISQLYNMQAAVEGLSKSEAAEFHKKISPLVKQAVSADYEFNPKAILKEVEDKFKDSPKLGAIAEGICKGLFLLKDSKVKFSVNNIYK